MRDRRALGFLFLTLLTGCSGSRVQPPPAAIPTSAILSSESGKASFFFPVTVPLSQVRRIVEESVPARMSDERKQEISGALHDDFYRYTLERGDVEVGFSGEWLTFSFPVRGRLTIGGRIGGLPVQETVALVCDNGDTFDVAVNGNGEFTPGRIVGDTGVLVPTSFGEFHITAVLPYCTVAFDET